MYLLRVFVAYHGVGSDSEYDESKFVDKKKPVPKINNRKKQNKKTTVK